jgi:hypothetical protein
MPVMENDTMTELPLRTRCFRLAVGLVLLAAFAGFFVSGYSPPGPLGEVLRHNQAHGIDASPLFYTEVENMHELESGLAGPAGGGNESDQYGAKTE